MDSTMPRIFFPNISMSIMRDWANGTSARMKVKKRNVCFGSGAAIPPLPAQCPLCANSGHIPWCAEFALLLLQKIETISGYPLELWNWAT
jgi:hypothetical protein